MSLEYLTCPIDSTPLIEGEERGHHFYGCATCGIQYPSINGIKPGELVRGARFYIKWARMRLGELRTDSDKLSKILKLAEANLFE